MSKTYCYSGTFEYRVEADSDEEADSIFRDDMENVYDYEVEDRMSY